MILYYSPGACSLADHIALCEADFPFKLAKVDLKSHRTEIGGDYLAINPKGYVPALEFDGGGILTENVAILSWIADRAPQLALPGEMGRYRLLEALAFISTEIHKTFKPFFDPSARADAKQAAGGRIAQRLGFLAERLSGDFLFGDFTVADAYLFVMLAWAKRQAIEAPAAFAGYFERVSSRPAVLAALRDEGMTALAAAA